ncbi:hypothetical protein G9A89_017990 [Geosiphon pyriformis]|nr:hypothetical protein G9A89_017990 [Geosiphon pyriformis]
MKKKVVLGNIKHSGNEKDISLNKFELGNNVFSDVDSMSGDEKSANMTGINVGSLLDSAANTPKAKHINTDAIFGSPFGSPNFVMDNDNDVSFPSHLSISLKKKWIDPKIIKTQVEVFAKKSFALNINLSAVERKSAMAKTHMNMAILLAREKRINVNSDLKRQKMRSDWAVIIKKIPMDALKDMIVATVSEFGEIKLIKIQLIRMWQKTVVEFAELNQADLLVSKWSFLIGKNSVYVAKAVENCKTWASRNWFKALLFTLPVGTTAHDLGNLLERAGRKTCIINRSIETGNKICCAVVSFISNDNLESVFHTKPIFNEIKLSWARMDLVHCEKCRHFGHSALECNTSDSASEEFHFQLTKLYEKKCVLISCPAAFGGKSWAQVVSFSKFSGNVHFEFGFSLSLYKLSGIGGIFPPVFTVSSGLSDCLVVLEKFLELLVDQMSDIMKKLSFVELVPLTFKLSVSLLVVSVPLGSVVDSNITLDNMLIFSVFPPLVIADTVADLNLSSSKVLTTKVGGLESKLVALEVSVESVLGNDLVWKFAMCNVRNSCNSVSIFTETKLKGCEPWIKNRFFGLKVFSSRMNSRHCKSGVVIILNNNFAHHVCKISKILRCLISVYLLFVNKASVMILGLYAGASAGVRFKQAFAVNVLIVSAISSSFYILFGGNFNENGAGRNVSFKKCSDLGLHNILSASFISKFPMWYNSRGVKKTIDFIFVSNYLLSAVFGKCIGRVSDYFNIDHLAVLISVGLDGLLDKQLNTLHKLANTDYWKFNFKDSDAAKWKCFDDCAAADILLLRDDFTAAKDLVLDDVESSKISGLLDTYSGSVEVFKQLSVAKKHYYKTKYIESKLAKNVSINRAISKHMDDFVSGKGNMINSILEHLFCKVVLDYLVLNRDLILELVEVKAKVDDIMVD